jgi:hypothetical protein
VLSETFTAQMVSKITPTPNGLKFKPKTVSDKIRVKSDRLATKPDNNTRKDSNISDFKLKNPIKTIFNPQKPDFEDKNEVSTLDDTVLFADIGYNDTSFPDSDMVDVPQNPIILKSDKSDSLPNKSDINMLKPVFFDTNNAGVEVANLQLLQSKITELSAQKKELVRKRDSQKDMETKKAKMIDFTNDLELKSKYNTEKDAFTKSKNQFVEQIKGVDAQIKDLQLKERGLQLSIQSNSGQPIDISPQKKQLVLEIVDNAPLT